MQCGPGQAGLSCISACIGCQPCPWPAPSPASQSANSGNTVRCPAGTCFEAGQGCVPSCGGKDCCAVSVDCGKGKMEGRTCSKKCKTEDPYFASSITVAGTYPTCPGGSGQDPK